MAKPKWMYQRLSRCIMQATVMLILLINRYKIAAARLNSASMNTWCADAAAAPIHIPFSFSCESLNSVLASSFFQLSFIYLLWNNVLREHISECMHAFSSVTFIQIVQKPSFISSAKLAVYFWGQQLILIVVAAVHLSRNKLSLIYVSYCTMHSTLCC